MVERGPVMHGGIDNRCKGGIGIMVFCNSEK